MCDHQRQTFRDGVTMPCAVPECIDTWEPDYFLPDGKRDRYTRECFQPSPEGTPAFWFWLRRDGEGAP